MFTRSMIPALVLFLLILPSWCPGSPIIWRVQNPPLPGEPLEPGDALADCTLGNLDFSLNYAYDFLQGDDEFAYLMDPADSNCCDLGFVPESITFLLLLDSGDLLANDIQVGVRHAVGDPGAYTPGDEICASRLGWTLITDLPGLYFITIPLYPDSGPELVCPCLDVGSPFFLVYRLLGDLEEGVSPGAVRDRTPVGGRSFYRQGDGAWQDLVTDIGWDGGIRIHTEAACCERPIPGEETGWGSFKSDYR